MPGQGCGRIKTNDLSLTHAHHMHVTVTLVSHRYQPFEITTKSVLRFLENGSALVWAFLMQWKPREWEIRLSSASNAFSEFPTPYVAHPGGDGNLERPTFSGNEGGASFQAVRRKLELSFSQHGTVE